MARKSRSSIRIEPLEARHLAAATLVTSFGSNGQLIGSAHKSGTDVIIPFGNTGIFQFTGGNTITRLLANGRPDTRFAKTGSLKLDTSNAVEAVAGADDGGVYVEYAIKRSNSMTVNDIGFQHFTKTGRLDRAFGSNRLLDLANYNHTATFAAGPLAVSDAGRIYFESSGTLYFIPDDGNVAGIRKTDTHSTGSRIFLRPDGGIFVLGSGVTAYNDKFQRLHLYGDNSVALSGKTIIDGAFDASNRLVLTVAGSSSTAAPTLVRLNTRGTLDPSFGSSGSIPLPTNFVSTSNSTIGSHLLVQPDQSVIVSGGVTITSGTKSVQKASLLAYDKRGRLIDKLFSTTSDGVLASSDTLEGSEVDVAPGPHGSVYVSTLIDENTGAFDFIEQFALKPFSGV